MSAPAPLEAPPATPPETHERGGLTDRLHGDNFHTLLVMLLLFRARAHDCRLEMAVEYTTAGLFDDVVLRWRHPGGLATELFGQLTHSDSLAPRPLAAADLFPDKKRAKGKFDLKRYLESYVLYTLLRSKGAGVRRLFVIYTNRGLDVNDFTHADSSCFEAFPDWFQDVFQRTLYKVDGNLECRNYLLEKLVEMRAKNNELMQLNLGEIVDNFLTEFGLAVGQRNVYELEEILKDEILKYYGNRKFKSNNIFCRLKVFVTDWMNEKVGKFVTYELLMKFFTDIEREDIAENVHFNFSLPNSLFHGRAKELEQLHTALQNVEKKHLLDFSVTGLAGVGKTELMLKYIQLHGGDYKHIIWINAENSNSLNDSFLRLGEMLNLCDLKEGNSIKVFQLIKIIYTKLNDSGDKCLFIFDNAVCYNTERDVTGIKEYLPPIKSAVFSILVTSQRTDWQVNSAISLDVFSELEAVEFLANNLRLDCDLKHKMDVANLLGKLPLALQLTVAYINEQKEVMEMTDEVYSIEMFLESYTETPGEVLSELSYPDNFKYLNYKKPLLKIWNLALQCILLNPNGKLAIQILSVISYLEPIQIPFQLIQNILSIHEKSSFQKALRLLHKFSLIKSQKGFVSIHRLLQDVTRLHCTVNDDHTYPSEQVILEKALSYFTDNCTQNNNQQSSLNITSDYLIHALKIWNSARKIKEMVIKFSNLSIKIFEDLNSQYLISNADEFTVHLKSDFDNYLEKSQPEYLLYLKEHGHLLNLHGYFDEAFQLVSNIVATMHETNYTNNLNYCSVLYLKACLIREKGQFSEAVDLYNEVFTLQKQILGADFSKNRKALRTLQNMALATELMCKFDDALKLYQDIIEMKEKNLGKDHYDIFETKERIGVIYKQQGRYVEALELFESVLEAQIEIKGPKHANCRNALYYIGWVLYDLELYDDSMNAFERDYEIEVAHFGVDYIEALVVMGRIAKVHLKRGEIEIAYTKITGVVEKMTQLLHENHPRVLRECLTLAMVLGEMGKINEAVAKFDTLLQNTSDSVGKDYFEKFRCDVLNEKAMLLVRCKNYTGALQILIPLLPKQELLYGKQHPDTLKMLSLTTTVESYLLVNFSNLVTVTENFSI